MRGHHLDRILATTALALVLGSSIPAHAQTVENVQVQARAPEGAPATPSSDVTRSIPSAATPAAAAPSAATPAAAAEPAKEPAAPAPQPTQAAQPPAPTAAPSAEPAQAAQPAATPAPEAAQAAQPAPSPDQALSDKLRDMFAGRGAQRFFTRPAEQKAAEAFYRDRNYAPLFVENSKQSPRGASVATYLQNVDADGLEPSDYPIPSFKAGDVDALADAELRMTGEVLEFARHATTGRVHYSRISNDIGYELEAADPAEVLTRLAAATDVKQAMDSYQPQHPQYKALKQKLAEARGRGNAPTEEIVRIPDGQKFKLGADDARVPLLRKRLKVAGDETSTKYDQAVADAVKAFQQGAGMQPDGVAGPATLRAMNGVQKRERNTDIIIANMDRWRWMPRDLGKNYVMVNIPEYRLRLFNDRKLYWETKIVVGKPTQATPITTAQMRFITVNPTWNVPPSIIANEYLPAVRQDPTVLERMGLRMEQNRDGTVRIYQPPGDKNALGRIRFNFPNKFLVYQHDTPDKNLFAHDKRAYSHGCMRVENPLLYGEKLLSVVMPQEKYTAEKLRSMYGPGEININFPQTLPVHLTYQTAWVDDAGTLQIRDDVYGRDARHIAILRGDERRVADVAQATRPTGTGISQDALRMQQREASPFADWFSSRQQPQATDRRGNRVVQSRNEPFGNFFGRMFR
jgi:murein L,D-transpeptidase YcbB/YkuD